MSDQIKRENPELLILVGPSGSGKTTFSVNLIKTEPRFKRVNRDDLRKLVMGELNPVFYYSPVNQQRATVEKHVTSLENEQILYWLNQGVSVVVDNTNLDRKFLYNYLDSYGHLADVRFKFFYTAVSVCKSRVIKRDNYVPSQVKYIDQQASEFKVLLSQLEGVIEDNVVIERSSKKLKQNLKKPRCIIVDIDGTIADHEGVRSPHEGYKCHLDKPIEQTIELIKRIRGGWFKRIFSTVKIVYLSGREDKFKDKTVQWIKDHKIPYDGKIFMRPTGDYRKDTEVKEELFKKHILPSYYTEYVVDDRISVVRNWSKLGLFTICINQSLKIF